MTLTVSIVIPNWNGRELLRACLDSLAAQDYSATEIVVVDNGSADGSPEMVMSEYPEVRLVRFPVNRGFSAAVNAGIRASTGGMVALINNDAEAHPAWASELAAAASRNPEAGFFASMMLFHKDRKTIDAFGDGFTVAGFGYKRGWGEDVSAYSEELPVLGACGGAAMYRRAVLDDIASRLPTGHEYFDEEFFAFGEDIDLSLRANLMGYRCMAVPGAVVYHKLRATAGRGSELSVYLSHRNFILTVMKNFPAPVILRNLHHIIMYNMLAAAADILKNRRFLYIKSYIAALRMWPVMRKKRKGILASARVTPEAFAGMLDRGWFGIWTELFKKNKSISAKGL